ncbi:MAG: lysylphosphatidylglycerol synthase domain-containing protein, partial [Candidatus Binataceae bacterium]
GDTCLFSLLFTFFHKKTTPRELLPATTAQYFLQAINQLAADGALIVFLNRRKGVKWLTATWTMMFQGLIDAMCLAGVATAAGLLVPHSAIRFALPYAGGAFGFLICVALWWAWGKPRTRPEKWMYGRPSAKAFREAGLREYLSLGAIRLSLMVAQGFLFYYSFVAFAPKVPLVAVLALTPGMLAAFNQPVTPAGLGPLQAIVVGGLSHYASNDRILAAALGISIMHLLCRLPLGLGAAGTFARRVLAIEAAQARDQSQEAQHADAMKVSSAAVPGA